MRRDREQLAQVGLRLGGDRHELLAAVAHLHDAHAAAAPVEHLWSVLTDYGEDFRVYEPGIVVTNLGTLRPSPTRS